MENEVPPTLRGDTRHPVGIGEVQRPHGEPPEGQSRVRGGPRAPHSGHARRPRALPREMRPRTPRSSTPFRVAMRACDEHALHAVGSAVQTSTSSLPSTNPRQRSPCVATEITTIKSVPRTRTTTEIIQFEAIARHQCWTLGERVVRLVASLTGPAANLLIGMTMGQLDDYAFLVARLSRRYDPPEHEEAHRTELRVRTRRRNETADEFAEYLKNLAQRAYTNADQSMLDNLVVERFREGHGNIELKKTFMLVPLNRTTGSDWRVRTF